MLIRLQKQNKTYGDYDPPIQIERYFGAVNRDESINVQIENLLWIPATLVSRFLGQFPFLSREADELFSIAACEVVEVTNDCRYTADQLGAICFVKGQRAIEEYANNLGSGLIVSTTTRYKNLKKRKPTPRTNNTKSSFVTEDDHTDVILRDAAEALGVDLNKLGIREKMNLARILEL